MPDRVPEVENRALALLTFILRHHFRFDFYRTAHDALQRRRMFGENRGVLLFEKREVLRIRNRAVLHGFREPRRQLHARQRAEQLRIGDDDTRLVERAEQVLAGGDVHARLAADRGVDHR